MVDLNLAPGRHLEQHRLRDIQRVPRLGVLAARILRLHLVRRRRFDVVHLALVPRPHPVARQVLRIRRPHQRPERIVIPLRSVVAQRRQPPSRPSSAGIRCSSRSPLPTRHPATYARPPVRLPYHRARRVPDPAAGNPSVMPSSTSLPNSAGGSSSASGPRPPRPKPLRRRPRFAASVVAQGAPPHRTVRRERDGAFVIHEIEASGTAASPLCTSYPAPPPASRGRRPAPWSVSPRRPSRIRTRPSPTCDTRNGSCPRSRSPARARSTTRF